MIRRLCARDRILSLQEEQQIGAHRDQSAKITSGESCPVPGGLGATAMGAGADIGDYGLGGAPGIDRLQFGNE